jgi:hypothetical protein
VNSRVNLFWMTLGDFNEGADTGEVICRWEERVGDFVVGQNPCSLEFGGEALMFPAYV